MAHIIVLSKKDRGEEIREDEMDDEKGFEELCKHPIEGKLFIPIEHPTACFGDGNFLENRY